MTRENLRSYAGSKIANFCRGYKTVYAHRFEDGEFERDKEIKYNVLYHIFVATESSTWEKIR